MHCYHRLSTALHGKNTGLNVQLLMHDYGTGEVRTGMLSIKIEPPSVQCNQSFCYLCTTDHQAFLNHRATLIHDIYI